MQINSGLVSVVQGDGTVAGNASVDWTQVTTASFIVIAGQPYDIISVDALAKEIEISPVYAGATASDIPYAIVRDFTVNHNLPLLNPGDLEAATILSRALSTIDRILSVGTGSADLGEILVTKTGHGFIAGNFLTLSGSVWTLALSDTSAHSIIVGVVKEVVNANQFKVVTQGRIANVAGITMTPGTVYYLRSSTVSGGGGNVNITDNLAFAGLQVPVLVAETSTDGWILNLARATTGIFGLDSSGLVPGPTASDISNGRVLGAGGGWVGQSIATNVLAVQHLLSGGSVDWTNFAAKQIGLSIFEHMLDLNTRVSALAAYSRKAKIHNGTRTKANPGTGSGSFTVPDRVSSVRLRVISGSYGITYSIVTSASGNTQVQTLTGQSGFEFIMDVAATNTISWEIGQVATLVSPPSLPEADRARIRIYKNGTLVIDVQPFQNDASYAPTNGGNNLSYNDSLVTLVGTLPGALTSNGLLYLTLAMYDFTYNQREYAYGELVLDDSTTIWKNDAVPAVALTTSNKGFAFPGGRGLYVSGIAGAVQIEYED